MKATRFPQANKILTAPPGQEGEVYDLPVWSDGARCISCWQPTEEERAAIARGESVWLWIIGSTQGARTIPDPPTEGALLAMASYLNAGMDVVIHSSRARYFGGIRAMRAWLKGHAGAMWYESPGGLGLESVRFTRWKPAALVTLDDRGVTFTGNWPEASTLRAFKPWNKA